MVPISVMPGRMHTPSSASPVDWGIMALDGATFRGLPTRALMPACVFPLAFGVASLARGRFWRRARARTERRTA
ncbi:MAG: hypothetical protein WAL97_05710 [Halobacteriota archaeon]